MHMLWRFILTFFKGRMRNKVKLGETTKLSMRVMPMDLDFLFHVNNGVYFSYLDHGRMDMIFRNGIFEVCRKNGWYGVVASESMKFYKSLKLFNKFEIQTTGKGFDNKYFFVQQKIIFQNKIMASALIKIRFLKKSGGAVSPQEIFDQLNQIPQNDLGTLSDEWHGLENKYLT
jgi:acyl-CoA thioesterase FadM